MTKFTIFAIRNDHHDGVFAWFGSNIEWSGDSSSRIVAKLVLKRQDFRSCSRICSLAKLYNLAGTILKKRRRTEYKNMLRLGCIWESRLGYLIGASFLWLLLEQKAAAFGLDHKLKVTQRAMDRVTLEISLVDKICNESKELKSLTFRVESARWSETGSVVSWSYR